VPTANGAHGAGRAVACSPGHATGPGRRAHAQCVGSVVCANARRPRLRSCLRFPPFILFVARSHALAGPCCSSVDGEAVNGAYEKQGTGCCANPDLASTAPCSCGDYTGAFSDEAGCMPPAPGGKAAKHTQSSVLRNTETASTHQFVSHLNAFPRCDPSVPWRPCCASVPGEIA
jgi:hypothetical protein